MQKIEEKLYDVIKYNKYMISFLEEMSCKRFDLLPRINLGVHFVHLGSKFLSTIYNEWKNLKVPEGRSHTCVPIKNFERDYERYYKEMFNFSYFNKRKDLENKIPISFTTDGISISCSFRTRKNSKKENDKNKSQGLKINIETEQIRKGLYDADNIICSATYLDKFYIEGDDPGNNQMINRVTEDQFTYSISKGFYNHESHINKNKNLRERIINKSDCREIYELLSNETHKTADLNKYTNYLKIIFENWIRLWQFNSNLKLCRLNYDTYINKGRAIKKIVNKMTRKRQRKRKRRRRK